MKFFTLFLVSFWFIQLSGQDIIFINQSDEIKCKILSIKENKIEGINSQNSESFSVQTDSICGYNYNNKLHLNSKINKEMQDIIIKKNEEFNANKKAENKKTKNDFEIPHQYSAGIDFFRLTNSILADVYLLSYFFEYYFNKHFSIAAEMETGLNFYYYLNTKYSGPNIYICTTYFKGISLCFDLRYYPFISRKEYAPKGLFFGAGFKQTYINRYNNQYKDRILDKNVLGGIILSFGYRFKKRLNISPYIGIPVYTFNEKKYITYERERRIGIMSRHGIAIQYNF